MNKKLKNTVIATVIASTIATSSGCAKDDAGNGVDLDIAFTDKQTTDKYICNNLDYDNISNRYLKYCKPLNMDYNVYKNSLNMQSLFDMTSKISKDLDEMYHFDSCKSSILSAILLCESSAKYVGNRFYSDENNRNGYIGAGQVSYYGLFDALNKLNNWIQKDKNVDKSNLYYDFVLALNENTNDIELLSENIFKDLSIKKDGNIENNLGEFLAGALISAYMVYTIAGNNYSLLKDNENLVVLTYYCGIQNTKKYLQNGAIEIEENTITFDLDKISKKDFDVMLKGIIYMLKVLSISNYIDNNISNLKNSEQFKMNIDKNFGNLDFDDINGININGFNIKVKSINFKNLSNFQIFNDTENII